VNNRPDAGLQVVRSEARGSPRQRPRSSPRPASPWGKDARFKTVEGWAKPDFAKAYRAARRQAFGQAIALTQRNDPLAVNTLAQVMMDKIAPHWWPAVPSLLRRRAADRPRRVPRVRAPAGLPNQLREAARTMRCELEPQSCSQANVHA